MLPDLIPDKKHLDSAISEASVSYCWIIIYCYVSLGRYKHKKVVNSKCFKKYVVVAITLNSTNMDCDGRIFETLMGKMTLKMRKDNHQINNKITLTDSINSHNIIVSSKTQLVFRSTCTSCKFAEKSEFV